MFFLVSLMDRDPFLVVGRIIGLALMLWVVHYALLSFGAEAVLGSSIIARVKAHKADKRRGEVSPTAKTQEQESRANMHRTSQDIISVVACSALVALYALTLAGDLKGSPQARIAGVSRLSTAGFYLHCGLTLYEASLYWLLGNDEGCLMYAHHFLVLFNYAWVLLGGGTHFWGSWLGLTEGTNVCLTPLLFHRRIDRLSGWTFLASFVGTWLGFLTLRIVSLSIFFYGLGADLHFSWVHYSGSVAWVQLSVGYLTAVGLFAMSCFWFYKLTKLAHRQLSGKNDDQQPAEGASEDAGTDNNGKPIAPQPGAGKARLKSN